MVKITLEGYKEHAEIIELAIAAREHMLLIGKPGTAKSLFAQQVFNNYQAKTFFVQLSKFSDESVLFGPIDISALKKGEFRFLYKNTILDAQLAFIDEIFDASDVLLRTLLSILNERIFSRGTFTVTCNLVTCIATANYSRINEITEAVIDRFLFQCEAPKLSQEQRKNLYNGYNYEELTISDSEKRSIPSVSVENIYIPEEIITALISIADDLSLTPRRERKIAKALKTRAALNARNYVIPDDLVIVPYMIPLDKQTKDVKDRIIETIKKISKEKEQIQLINSISCPTEYTLEAAQCCAKALKTLRSITPCSDAVKNLLQEKTAIIEDKHKKILQELGII